MKATKQQLLGILDDVRRHIEEGDSFEGTITYTIPDFADVPRVDFFVEARYRVGNREGQGSLRIID